MNKYLSFKLKVISFFLIILVVYLHSYNVIVHFKTAELQSIKGYNFFIQDFFSQGITRIAVPLFFLISSYLFFINYNGTFQAYLVKIKKRINTLFIPYLFWSLFGVGTFFCLQLIPVSSNFFSNELIRDYPLNKLLEIIFINPIPFQLWFIRDLMILAIISPFIYYLIINLKLIALIPFLIIWIVNLKLYFISSEALFFFMCGTYLSIQNSKLITLIHSSSRSKSLFILWISLVFIKTCLMYINFQDLFIINILLKLSILIGIIGTWGLYDMLFDKKVINENRISSILPYTFFIYAFHIPFLGMLQKSFFYIFGKEEFIFFAIYLFTPIITITFSILLAVFLKNKLPSFYNVITGKR